MGLCRTFQMETTLVMSAFYCLFVCSSVLILWVLHGLGRNATTELYYSPNTILVLHLACVCGQGLAKTTFVFTSVGLNCFHLQVPQKQ